MTLVREDGYPFQRARATLELRSRAGLLVEAARRWGADRSGLTALVDDVWDELVEEERRLEAEEARRAGRAAGRTDEPRRGPRKGGGR